MQDRPTAHELLEAVRRFLETEVVPHTEGRRQFLARVAANVVRMVDREVASEAQTLAAEWDRLDALLGREERPEAVPALREGIRRRTEVLCQQIREGLADAGPYRDAVFQHLRATVRDKLLVTNPSLLEG
jgi:hypothetical protein